MQRTEALLGLYNGMPHEQGEDLLRAVVVWLHGALEDTMRLHITSALKEAGSAVLDRVPLVGAAGPLRAEKFYLGALAQFRGRAVDDVISESIDAYAQRLTFNNFGDVAAALHLLGLDVDRLDSLKDAAVIEAVNALCERRHRIVHEGDLTGGMRPELRPLAKETVVGWQRVVLSYIARSVEVVESLRAEQAMGPEWTAEMNRKQVEESLRLAPEVATDGDLSNNGIERTAKAPE